MAGRAEAPPMISGGRTLSKAYRGHKSNGSVPSKHRRKTWFTTPLPGSTTASVKWGFPYMGRSR